jgi:hypothetical protein
MKRKPKTPAAKRAANAARQAEYRRRHLTAGASLADKRYRLNLVVSSLTSAGLKRLANHYGVTQVDILHRLVEDAEGRAIKPLKADRLREYYGDAV